MKLWEALKAVDEGMKVRRTNWDEWVYVFKGEDGEYYKSNGADFDMVYLDNTNEWEFYDDRKYVHPFFRNLYKIIMELGPEYQEMLDTYEKCKDNNCNDCSINVLCRLFDDLYTTLECCNDTHKLDKEHLHEDEMLDKDHPHGGHKPDKDHPHGGHKPDKDHPHGDCE
jgi:hypothetical protein